MYFRYSMNYTTLFIFDFTQARSKEEKEKQTDKQTRILTTEGSSVTFAILVAT